ncbi:MAG TPA: histidine triad nucleotide-binding protein [Myxococcota bacterium]|nr:histidine triad nucleotide-binding protein [Myxococcota bacterium]
MTIFERVIAGEFGTEFIYQDDRVVAFRDIHPQAPVHVLVVPRRALPGVSHATPEDAALLGHVLVVASEVARREGVAAGGYRLVINDGANGGQTVPHLHVHVLGGRAMGWPPG